eukprot:2820625-Lingulodinium_polyedra.AAC.1
MPKVLGPATNSSAREGGAVDKYVATGGVCSARWPGLRRCCARLARVVESRRRAVPMPRALL